jgi:hypothetical protein
MRSSSLFVGALAALALLWSTAAAAQAQAPVLVTIDVASYGAIPDDQQDDYVEISQAVQAASNSAAPVELIFHPGTYDLATLSPSGSLGAGPLFQISNVNGIRIVGNDATLLCHGYLITTNSKLYDCYYDLFLFEGCTDVTVEDLTVDMVRAPFTFGTCWSVYAPPKPPVGTIPVASRYFEMTVDASQLHDGATSVLDLRNMNVDLFTHHDPLGVPNGRLFFHNDSKDPSLPHSFQVIKSTPGGPFALHRIKGIPNAYLPTTPPTAIGPGQNLMEWGLCENGQSTFGALQANDFVVAVHHFNQHVCFGFRNCDGIHVEDVRIHKFPGKGLWGFMCANLSVEGLELIPHTDPGWPGTLTGDGIWFADCRGSAHISDSHFEGLFDDGINIHTSFFPVTRSSTVGTGFQIVIPEGHTRVPTWFRIGDVIQLCDPDMRPYAQATITTAATTNNQNELILDFPGAGSLPADSVGRDPTAICNLSWFPQDYTISNCLFRTIRGNGIRLHANALVSDCTFQNVTTSAIACGPLWYEGDFTKGFCEGPSVGNLQISNCDILRTTYGWGFNKLNHGAIQVQASIKQDPAVIDDWRTGSYHSLAQILIDGCTIHEVGGAALTGRDVRGLEVRNCQFGSVGIAGHLLPLPFQRAGQSLLYFDQAGDISILNNAMLPGGSWTWQGTGDQQGLNMHGTYSKSGNTGL